MFGKTLEEAGPALTVVSPEEERARESRAQLIRDSGGYLISKVVPGFSGLISVPVFVHLIGIEEYGRLAVILPILQALVSAGAGWLQQSILRFHPSSEVTEAESTFSRAVVLGTGYAVLILALAVVPVLVILHYGPGVWVIAETYCAAQLIYLVSLSRRQAQLRPGSVLRNEALRSVAGFLLPLLLVVVAGRKSFSLVVLGLALGYIVPLPFTSSGLALRTQGANPICEASTNILKQLWHFGWAMGLWLMLCQALPVIGRSVIHKYAGYAQAGVYASLYELAVRCFSLFASPVIQAAHPRIMRHWNCGDHAAARNTIRHSILFLIVMYPPIAAIGVAFAGPLTRLIVGSNNFAPASLLPLLMLGGFLWQIALLIHKPLEIMRRTKTMLCGMLVVLLIEFTGDSLLVPRFGMAAAVYVFVFGALAYIGFTACCSVLLPDQSAVYSKRRCDLSTPIREDS
jgi:O-antigen/teichoic acid export membrane protein